jgi:L-ascorbate metabolism protein UlaG (beta-lactamase superfamily)
MPKAHAFQAWVKAAYLSHNTFFIPSASPCLQAWVVDIYNKKVPQRFFSSWQTNFNKKHASHNHSMANSTVFSGVRVVWFGHSSVMLEADGIRVYIDPFVLPRAQPPADIILYSHGHYDHAVAAPSITTTRTVLIGNNCKLPVRVIEIGATEKVGSATIKAVHAYNINKPYHPRDKGAGFLIQFRTARVYFAGDTDLIPEMKDCKCDIALLPIGGTYTMDAQEAADAVEIIAPKVAIPMHYNYLSDTRTDPAAFKAAVAAKPGVKTDVRILSP